MVKNYNPLEEMTVEAKDFWAEENTRPTLERLGNLQHLQVNNEVKVLVLMEYRLKRFVLLGKAGVSNSPILPQANEDVFAAQPFMTKDPIILPPMTQAEMPQVLVLIALILTVL